MDLTVKDGVDLLKATAWPIIALVALIMLHRPVSQLIGVIGQRVRKISIFKVELALGEMTKAQPSVETRIDRLRMVAVAESGMEPILAGLGRSAAADYVTIPIGADADRAWITSRLFILAAILERSRSVRCLVFTGEQGAYLGAAAVRDVRFTLGSRFPEYEQALFAAQAHVWGSDIDSVQSSNAAEGAPMNVVRRRLSLEDFRGGGLSADAISAIAHRFLNESDIVCRDAAAPSAGWIFLDRSQEKPPGQSTFERADWVTAGAIVEWLDDRISRGAVVAAAGAEGGEALTRAIVRQPGAFVALLTKSGAFHGLCDRRLVVEAVARGAAEQAAAD